MDFVIETGFDFNAGARTGASNSIRKNILSFIGSDSIAPNSTHIKTMVSRKKNQNY